MVSFLAAVIQYASRALEPGCKVDLIYQYAASDTFTFQFHDSAIDLETLMDNIQDFIATDPPALPPEAMTVGQPVLAQYSVDKLWYRGTILALPEGGTVEVLFVDYGNAEGVAFYNVREITLDLMALCKQALLCQLQGSSGSVMTDWSEEMIGQFEILSQKSDFLTATIVECDDCHVVISFVEECPDWAIYFNN